MKSLLRSREKIGNRWVGIYETCGLRIRVYDDARTTMKVIKLFADEELSPQAKEYVLLRLLFPDPEKVVDAAGVDMAKVLSEIIWETSGLDITGERISEHKKPVFDWDADEPFIRTTMLTAYGKTLDELAEGLTYKDLTSLLFLAPHDTPMGQAIYYRTAKPPKPTKHNAEEIKHFRKMQSAWALKTPEKRTENQMKAASESACSTFAAFANNAKRG